MPFNRFSRAVGPEPAGRDPSAAFDTNGYLAANPDVAAAHANPLDHFMTFGVYEGRQAVNDRIWH